MISLRFYKESFFFFFLFVLLGSIQIAYAQELRIGYSSDKPPYQYTNKKGEADGLIIDFWRIWSQKNNTPVYFVATTSAQALLSLKNGEIDAHAGLDSDTSHDPTLYQGSAIYESSAIIFTDKNIEYSGSINKLNAYRVAVIQQEFTSQYLRNYLQNTAIVSFSDYPQLMDAVAEREIKVFAADALTSFFYLNKRNLLNSFYYNRSESLFTTKWRPTTLVSNKEIRTLISSGMKLISLPERNKTLRRWSSGIPHTNTGAIIIATPIKYPPLSVIGSDGKARGYLIDFWREWGRQVDRKIQFRGSVWNETLRGIKSGEADIHSGLFINEERKTWLTFSSPFFNVATALFYKSDKGTFPSLDKLTQGSVGAIDGSYQEAFLKKQYPSLHIIGYADLDRMFVALFQDDIVAIVAEEPEVIGTLNKLGLSGAVQKGEKLFQNDLYAGVLKENKELMELVNRGINAIPEPVKRELLNRYFPSGRNWSQIALWFGIFLIPLLCGIVFISLNNRTLNRRIKERTSTLEESEKRLWKILDNAPLGILIANSHTMLLQYANPSICQMLGYDKEELEGMDVASLHTPADFNQVSIEFRALAEGEKNTAIDIPFLQKNGTLLELDVNAASIILDKSPHLAAFLLDHTETRKLGLQLQHAQKMEAIGMMAGGVAHDLNNILSGIVSYPELLLLKLPESSELISPLKAIQESGNRAAAVVADLLTVARGVATTRTFHNIHVLINEYLHSPECEKVHSLYPEIACIENLEAEYSIIFCAPVHIKKAVMNLVNNGMEAITGKGTIFISTRNQRLDTHEASNLDIEAGDYLILSVKDDGIGITEKDLKHIFEPFYTKKVMGKSGTGLGLAIVWNSMQDHDGMITVKSTGQGTRFDLYFPIDTKAILEVEDIVPAEEFTDTNKHILVVDDEPQLCDIASKVLEGIGYTVDAVCSGELAISFVKDNPVDLVVLDMQMVPGINGYQTYKEILKMYPDQKSVVVSGFSESDEVKATLRLGAGGFIKKPYSVAQLGRVVEEALHS